MRRRTCCLFLVAVMVLVGLHCGKAPKPEPEERKPVRTGADFMPSETPTPPIVEATQAGDLEKVKALLAQGADVNAKDKFGSAALHEAAKEGRKEIAALLIAKGAEIDLRDNCRSTPLLWAANMGHCDVAALLVEKGADVNAVNNINHSPLERAVKVGHKDVEELLNKHGAKMPETEKKPE